MQTQSIKKHRLVVLFMALLLAVIPTSQVFAATQIAHMSGSLKSYESRSQNFYVSRPVAVQVAYSSFAQESDNAAPITIYIDGKKVAKSNGYGGGSQIWSVTAGYHTLKVEGNSLWTAFSVDIVSLGN